MKTALLQVVYTCLTGSAKSEGSGLQEYKRREHMVSASRTIILRLVCTAEVKMHHLLEVVCVVAALVVCSRTQPILPPILPPVRPPIQPTPWLFPCGCDSGDQVLSGCDDCNSGVQRLQLGSVKMYGMEYQSYRVSALN